VDTSLLERGLGRVRKFLEDGVAKGKLEASAKDATLAKLTGTTRVEDLAACDFVIEAIVENLPAKRDLFDALDAVVAPGCIFASNTSSLSVTEMAAATKRPERFVGLHFFNPVPLMKLVEVVRTLRTDPEVLADVNRFAESLGKTVVGAQDTPGF